MIITLIRELWLTLLQVFQAGAVIGVFAAGWVADKWGRKNAFRFCSFFSLLGGALLCGSRNMDIFIVG